jgi:hypothetical protein
MKKVILLLVHIVATVMLLVLTVVRTASAEDTGLASQLPEWLNSIEIHSFLSVGYVYNFNDPLSDTNTQRFFDFKHNEFRCR